MRRKPTKTLIAIALGIGLVTGAAADYGGFPGDGPGRHRGDPAERIDRMTEQLSLTPEQQTQIRTIIDEERTAAQRLRAETRQRIDAVLTDAQRAERQAMMKQRFDRELDRLARRLQLTPEQATQLGTIFAERQTNPELTRDELRQRIAAVLTPEQVKRFEDMRLHGRRHGGPDRGTQDGRDGPPDETSDGPGTDR